MADDDIDVKNYAIYFAFIAVITILAINLVKADNPTFSVIYLVALLATLFMFVKIVLGLNTPKLPKIGGKSDDSGKVDED
jgi:heme/copper-type cytochrome/quinol oxidase subunit 4